MIKVRLENTASYISIIKEAMRHIQGKISNSCVASLFTSTSSIIGKLLLTRDFYNLNACLFVDVDIDENETVMCFEGGVGTVITEEYTRYLGIWLEKYLSDSDFKCPVCTSILNLCKQIEKTSKDIIPTPFIYSPNTVFINAKCITCEYFLHKLIIEYLRFLCMKKNVECNELHCVLSNIVDNQEKKCKALDELNSVRKFVREIFKGLLLGRDIQREYDLEPIVREIISNGLVCDKHKKVLNRL